MWQQWLVRPEHVRIRQLIFQLHLWVGVVATPWVLLVSISGSVLVFRDQLATVGSIDWILRLHTTLLTGELGQLLNLAGACALIILCFTGAVIWWPGVAHWRRSLTIEWHGHLPRIYWDAHSALGFWFLAFVSIWGISGVYLLRPHLFDVLYHLDPADRIADPALFSLSMLHFGRFNLLTQIVWAMAGLIPGALAFTGLFICCRRVLFQHPSSPKHPIGRPANQSEPVARTIV